jgi:hypothetical protein
MRFALAAALALATLVHAQTNRGAITGTVTDPTGAVVPGAKIVVTNVGTNETHRVATSDSGSYTVQDLEPVEYKIAVDAAGFAPAVTERVKVDTASTSTVNFRLTPGNVKTEVTVVSAAAPLVNVESGTSGQTITEMQFVNAPLANRSVLDLALTVPNVTGDVGTEDPGVGAGGTQPGYNLTINGGRSGSSLMLADGVNNTGVGLARAVVSFSPETVQEMSVQTNAYSAEFGRTGGGVINVTTKSGTNQFHGTALYYGRNPALSAAPYTLASTNRSPSTLRDNEFSMTAGGPVYIPKVYNGRNRTFFFAAVEPRYRTDHVQVDGLMADDTTRSGNFSNTVLATNSASVAIPAAVASQFPSVKTSTAVIYQAFTPAGTQLSQIAAPSTGTLTPYPNNTLPASMLDPVDTQMLQYIPKPNTGYYIDPSGALANYVTQRFLQDDNTRYTARIDENISQRNHLNLRATIVPIVGKTGFNADYPASGSAANYSNSKQFMVADTHSISPTVINDLRLNYTRGRFSNTFGPQWDVKTGANLSTMYGLPSMTKGGLPVIVDGLGTYGQIGEGGSILGDDTEERYNAADSVFISRGRMSFKIGVDVTHELLNTTNYLYSAGGTYNFSANETSSTGVKGGSGGIQFASYLLGVPDTVSLNDALLSYYYRWNSGAAFIQDDWRVSSSLTLNFGLRYSLQLPRTEKYNHQGSFLPALAQSFPLPQPQTLITGQVITSALVPPFAFDGAGGRSRYLWPADYTNFEPRFGFAWVPRISGIDSGRFVVRGGYGMSHSPLNGQNRQPFPNFSSPATSFSETSGQVNSKYVMRMSSNPPNDPALTWSQVLNIPSNGLNYLGSLNYTSQGFAIAPNMRTPSAQSWNLSLSFRLDSKDVIEAGYVGNKGTHLFMNLENQNASNIALVDALYAVNQSPTTTVADPLGRVSTTGSVIQVQQGTLASTFLGFNNLYTRWDSSADSIRHAGFISWVRRPTQGLTVSTNYTFGKSLDDASDSAPEGATLTSQFTQVSGASFGGTRSLDRSVSAFDVKHSLMASVLYDLPFGRKRQFFTTMPKALDAVFGNWSVSGIERLRSALPFMPVIEDNNGLGDNASGAKYSMRPDEVSGVPVVNPLWRRSCPYTTECQPYLNPAAFERPALGSLGDAPRTLDAGRGPMQNYFDASVQKSVPIHEGRVTVQFRVDLLNAFNHPTFGPGASYTAGDLFTGAPSTSPITAANYNSWAAANNQPQSTTAAGAAQLAMVQAFVTSAQNSHGVLPPSFFTTPLPTGFSAMSANSFNILTAEGYKLYALKNVADSGFGVLSEKANPRYIQFGVKIYF